MAEASQDKLWTPANIVTMIRICCVPVFVVVFLAPWPDWVPFQNGEVWKPWLSALVFVLIAATDAVDGYLARSRNEVTNFGKFMDPLADKILVCAALLALTELNVLPSWVTLVILTREFIVSGMRMIAANNGVVIAASWYGKAKTVTQMLAIVLFILKDGVHLNSVQGALNSPLFVLAWLVMIIALVLTVLSMVDYLAKSKELLGFTSSKHTPNHSHDSLLSYYEDTSSREHEREITDDMKKLIHVDSLNALATRVVKNYHTQNKTIACAESLTGGLICATLTEVAGSSQVVLGGINSYTNAVKEQVLGVHTETINQYGVVSENTALAMAEGVRNVLHSDISVSVTGIAGPTGAEKGKPIGSVCISISSAHVTSSYSFVFPGNREQVRLFTVRAALELLDNALHS